jgi:hypothetical protein
MSIPREIPYVTIAKGGVHTRVPVQLVERAGEWRPVPVSRNPKIGLPPPIAIGEGASRRNYDIDEVILTDWSGGMGEDTYAAATEPRSFQASQCDTRWPNVLVCRPLATQLGSAMADLDGIGARVTELGYANARLLAYAPEQIGYRLNGATWTAIQHAGTDITVFNHTIGLSGVFIAGQATGVQIFRSADGATWEQMAKTPMLLPDCVCEFDQRLWALDTFTNPTTLRNTFTAYASVDVSTVAAGGGTWVTGASFAGPYLEVAVKLFTWLYPPDDGRPTLWCLTTSRLLYYDYYAATPSWQEWFVFRTPQGATAERAGSDACVSPVDNNLYVALWGKSMIWKFTGRTIEQISPNKRGGLPSAARLQPTVLAGHGYNFCAFAEAHVAGGGGTGAALAVAEGGQFHHLHDHASLLTRGGGVGEQKIWVVTSSGGSGTVWELDNPDDEAVPPNATTRTYAAGALVHKTAWINGGLKNVNKRVLYAEIDALTADGEPGLDAGATVKVEIVTRSATTTLGTLTAASTFPAVLAVAGGIACKEWQVWLTLTRGTATTATPIIRAAKIGYRPRPKQRHTYAVRADVRDEAPAFTTPDGKFFGNSASALRLYLDEVSDNDENGQDDELVGLIYGGDGNSLDPRYRSVPQTELLIQAQESPDGADGLYLLSFSDISAPSSG